jgi:transcriptional regulator with XRE-family HTH domain
MESNDLLCYICQNVGGGKVELNGGLKLRALREALGCTMRHVEDASSQIARRLGNEEFTIPPSRLSDIETKGVVPSIFRLYSLAAIYRRDYREFLGWYGVDLNDIHLDIGLSQPASSHLTTARDNVHHVNMPIRLDPSFVLQKTTNLGRMIEKWGSVPLTYLSSLVADERYTYGYIGTEDFTMYPILPPGSFVQVDESKNKVTEGVWRSEFERPIYFVETREGFVCSWCNVRRDTIVLQPHPLSPTSIRVLRHPQEAEVIGQVVGVAMRLGEWHHLGPPQEPKAPAALP